MNRRPLTVLGIAALLGSAAAVTGFAATLRVDSGSIDTFGAGLQGTTTTTSAPQGDTTAPVLTTLEMFDVNGNGKVDQVKATFNETLANYTAGAAPWFLTDVPSGGGLAGASVSGSVATLTIAEGSGAANTAVGSFKIALAQHANGIRDAAGNRSSFAATVPGDKAAPARLAMEMFDINTAGSGSTPNGKIDRVVVTFSETLAAYTAGTAQWTLTNVPSNGSLNSVTPVSGTTAQLNLAEGTGGLDTAVGGFTVQLAANAAGVRDAAGNESSFGSAAPTDRAKPVPVSLIMSNGQTAGAPNRGDTQTIVFSEALDPASICTGKTADFELADNADNLQAQLTDGTPERLTFSSSSACSSSLSVGSITLGSADYVASGSVTFSGTGTNRTEVRWTSASRQLVLRLGDRTGSAATITADRTATYTPSSTMTDLAGNSAHLTVTFTGRQF